MGFKFSFALCFLISYTFFTCNARNNFVGNEPVTPPRQVLNLGGEPVTPPRQVMNLGGEPVTPPRQGTDLKVEVNDYPGTGASHRHDPPPTPPEEVNIDYTGPGTHPNPPPH